MNKKILIIASVLVVAIGASIYYFSSGSKLPKGCTQENAGLYSQPQESYIVDHYIISCGDNVVTHIGIKKAKSRKPSDVVIINGYFREQININWLDDRNIKIDYKGEDNQTTKYQNKFKDINIQLTHNGQSMSTR